MPADGTALTKIKEPRGKLNDLHEEIKKPHGVQKFDPKRLQPEIPS